MRATLQRRREGTDGYGGPLTVWDLLRADLPCHAWIESPRKSIGNERSVELAAPMMIVPLGTDVTSEDRVYEVHDRREQPLFGLMMIDAVARRADHLELRCRSHE